MSAWIVGKEHIDLLVTAALAWELVVAEKAEETGRMLWLECQRSVAYRYPNDKDGQWPGPIGLTVAEIEGYTFEAIEGIVDPAVLKVAAASYAYQSCEHPDWEDSAAYKLALELRSAAEAMMEGHNARHGSLSDHDVAFGDCGGWDVDRRDILALALAKRQASVVPQ